MDYYSHVSLCLYPRPWASRSDRDGPGLGHTSPSATELQREDAPRDPVLPRHGGQRRRPGAALTPLPHESTVPEGMAGSDHCLRVYAGSRDRVTRWVERNLEMYAQLRQANTEMRHDSGLPSKVVSQVVNAQRSGQ